RERRTRKEREEGPRSVVACTGGPMQIPTDVVAAIVAEASAKMSDPNYSAVLVGGFVQEQGPTAAYSKAHAAELGGAAGVVHAIFHAALAGMCFQRGHNRGVPRMPFEDRDRVAADDRSALLLAQQPAIHGYLAANV